MKRETLETWLLQLDSMVAMLTTAARLRGLNAQELAGLDHLKHAVDSFEASIEERERGLRIPPESGLFNTLRSNDAT